MYKPHMILLAIGALACFLGGGAYVANVGHVRDKVAHDTAQIATSPMRSQASVASGVLTFSVPAPEAVLAPAASVIALPEQQPAHGSAPQQKSLVTPGVAAASVHVPAVQTGTQPQAASQQAAALDHPAASSAAPVAAAAQQQPAAANKIQLAQNPVYVAPPNPPHFAQRASAQ